MGAQATFLASRWARGCPKVAQDGISLVLPLTTILANLLEEHVGLELPSRGDKVSHNFLLGHPPTQELGSVGEAGPVRQEHKIRGGGGLPVVSVHDSCGSVQKCWLKVLSVDDPPWPEGQTCKKYLPFWAPETMYRNPSVKTRD